VSEQDLGPLFRLPEDPHHLWILGVVLAGLAIAVLAVGLVRGRLPATLLLPALLLPLAAFGVGYQFTLEESKRVEFCGSCHETMSPLVAALAEDNGTISSSHWRRGAVSHASACYQCHSGYGIWGDVDAKLAGVRHMVLTVTGRYELPLQAHRFDNGACLGCHAQAVPFAEIEEHRDPETQAELLSGETSCAGICHEDGHPESALWGMAGPPAAAGGR
jgi:nitrate/TMAO reductase-like tetraheme cytochrome c subunit